MGKGEVLAGALSWERIIKQGGALGRSWERKIWDNELEDAAASPGLLCPSPWGETLGISGWTRNWCHQGSMEVLSKVPQPRSHLSFPTGIDVPSAQLCCGSTAGRGQVSVVMGSKPNSDKS